MGANEPQNPNRIDPEAWYSDNNVMLLFGVGFTTQEQARAAGQLQYRMLGLTAMYQGQWLLDWLKQETPPATLDKAKTLRRQVSNLLPAASGSPAGFPSHLPERTHDMAGYTDPVREFNDRIAKLMTTGLARRKAMMAVLKQDPALHEAYLRATNPSSVQDLIGQHFELARSR